MGSGSPLVGLGDLHRGGLQFKGLDSAVYALGFYTMGVQSRGRPIGTLLIGLNVYSLRVDTLGSTLWDLHVYTRGFWNLGRPLVVLVASSID